MFRVMKVRCVLTEGGALVAVTGMKVEVEGGRTSLLLGSTVEPGVGRWLPASEVLCDADTYGVDGK